MSETFRDRLKREHPEYVDDAYTGGCSSCPYDYGYEPRPDDCDGSESVCRKCWDREIPTTSDSDSHDRDSITLTQAYRTVTATLWRNSKIILSAEARCHPDDKFVFHVGADLAMQRLFDKMNAKPESVEDKPVEKEVKPVKKKLKFKVGDRVKANCEPVYGLSGVIIGIDGDDDAIVPYLVSFTGFTEGHNGTQSWLTEGHAMPEGDHSCYWCTEDELQLDKRSFDAHVGDYIRIRQWDDMVKEFGCEDGTIHCDHHFVDSMSYMCGKFYKVKDVDTDSGAKMYHVEHEAWGISDDMIERVIPAGVEVSNPLDVNPIKAGFCLCGARVNEDQSFCSTCGRKLDWSDWDAWFEVKNL